MRKLGSKKVLVFARNHAPSKKQNQHSNLGLRLRLVPSLLTQGCEDGAATISPGALANWGERLCSHNATQFPRIPPPRTDYSFPEDRVWSSPGLTQDFHEDLVSLSNPHSFVQNTSNHCLLQRHPGLLLLHPEPYKFAHSSRKGTCSISQESQPHSFTWAQDQSPGQPGSGQKGKGHIPLPRAASTAHTWEPPRPGREGRAVSITSWGGTI